MMMFNTAIVRDADERSAVCRAILSQLPEWFGNPTAIDGYVADVKDYYVVASYAEDQPIGFCAVELHNERTAEVAVMGVLHPYHRHGIGRSLFEKAEAYAVSSGRKYLTVKTLDKASDYEPYARTRRFYRSMGFDALQTIKGFWDEENPCLIMIKELK
jgi:GNAT superfamily N-acetyltransferase